MLDLTIALWMIFILSFGLWAAGFVVGTTKIKFWFLLLAVWFPLVFILAFLRHNNITLPSITIIELPANAAIGIEGMLNLATTLLAMTIVLNLVLLTRYLIKKRRNKCQLKI